MIRILLNNSRKWSEKQPRRGRCFISSKGFASVGPPSMCTMYQKCIRIRDPTPSSRHNSLAPLANQQVETY